MKRLTVTRIFVIFMAVLWVIPRLPLASLGGEIEWQQSFGGTGWDSLQSVRQTPDGGYILGGYSNSWTNGNKTSPNYGMFDYWVIRVDPKGNKVWEQTFGGTSNDWLHSVAVTSDGGFVLGGESFSRANGNKSSTNFGGSDYWVLRLDGNGNKLWEASFGGSSNDVLHSVQPMPDGGFVLGGWSFSNADGNKTSTNYGGSDFWIVRLDANGHKLWERTYGGTANETNINLELTSDGGFVFAGDSDSGISGNKGIAGHGWAVQLDADGNKVWESASGFLPGGIIKQTHDGGFIWAANFSYQPQGYWATQFYVTRLDSYHNQLWQTTLLGFGSQSPIPVAGLQEITSGYLLGVRGSYQDYDLRRLDSAGNELGRQTFGGGSVEYLFSVEVTSDCAVVLGGESYSEPGGNKTAPHYGSYDFWLVKLQSDRFALSISEIPGRGTIRVAPSADSDGKYCHGTVVTLEAVSNPGFRFDSWVTNSATMTNNPLTVTLNGDEVVSASFIPESPMPPILAHYPAEFTIVAESRQSTFVNFQVWNDGGGTLGYSLSSDALWLQVPTNLFTGVGNLNTHTLTLDPSTLPNRTFVGTITISPTNENLTAQTVVVNFIVNSAAPISQWRQNLAILPFGDLSSVLQTSDGGFIVGGSAASSPSNTYDVMLARLDANGNRLWNHYVGYTGNENLASLLQTRDGGYVLGGWSDSIPTHGKADFWISGQDTNGITIWERLYGGTNNDYLTDIKSTVDGGFIAGGYSDSPASGSKTSQAWGGNDYWLLRLDGTPNKIWERSFGGTQNDELRSVVQTADHGFLLGGASASIAGGNKTSTNFGNYDFWIVRLDSDGNKVWERSYGGAAYDYLMVVQPTLDGGFILGGQSNSGIGGNKTSPTFGGLDYWVVRIDANGGELWDRSFGGLADDTLFSLVQTVDGGFLLGGGSKSRPGGNKTAPLIGSSSFWIVRLDADGNKLWEESFGNGTNDYVTSLQATADGGYILGGANQFFVIKLSPEWPLLQLLPHTTEIRFLLHASLPGAYAFDRSPDLVNWQPWQTNLFTGGRLEIVDPDASQAIERFYRARKVP